MTLMPIRSLGEAPLIIVFIRACDRSFCNALSEYFFENIAFEPTESQGPSV